MDLLSTIRKTGSRGGVNFSWDEVANSSHRQNYLGHSVKAPVGRWQQGKDLNWYSKAGTSGGQPGETDEERQARERKEEMRRVKEAEEDAMALALGLPPPQRNTSGANAIEVDNKRQIGPARDEEANDEPREKRGRDRSHRLDDTGRRERRKHRSRSRSRDRERERGRDHDRRRRHRSSDRDRSQERTRHRRERSRGGRDRTNRSHSRDRRNRRDRRERDGSRRRHRSRSRDRGRRDSSPRRRDE